MSSSDRPGVPDAVRQQEAKALTAALRAANKSSAELALQAKVSDSYIAQIKSGHRPMSLAVAGRLAEALGLNLEDLSPRLARATHAALQLASPPPRAASTGRAVYKLERKPSLDQALLTLAEHLAAVSPGTRKAVLLLLAQLETEAAHPAEVIGHAKAVLESGKRLATEGAAPESIASPN